MQVTLGVILAAKKQGTKKTAEDVVQFLDYCVTHPDAVIRYHVRDMILRGHINASYLSKSKARSRAGGKFYLGLRNYNNTQETNWEVMMVSIIMKNVISLAAEAEVGSLFHNCQEAKPLQVTLE